MVDEAPQIAGDLPKVTTLEKINFINEAKNAFNFRRRIEIQGLPKGLPTTEIRKILFSNYDLLDMYVADDNRIHILLSTPEEAKRALHQLEGKKFNDKSMFVRYSQSTFLLFVGNIPYDYTIQQFRAMMIKFGTIERIFLVRSESTGLSKGYGFVEYLSRESVDKAKKDFNQTLRGRKLRIDFANFGLFEYNHIHSVTLFVDKFPPQTKSMELKEIFESESKPLFCQIATNPVNNKQRNFALADFATPKDAEAVWFNLDGSVINGAQIRIAFGSPARTGASIIGGKPNETPQLKNIPIPESMPKISNVKVDESKSSKSTTSSKFSTANGTIPPAASSPRLRFGANNNSPNQPPRLKSQAQAADQKSEQPHSEELKQHSKIETDNPLDQQKKSPATESKSLAALPNPVPTPIETPKQQSKVVTNIPSQHEASKTNTGPRFRPHGHASKERPEFSPRGLLPNNRPRFSPRGQFFSERPRYSPRGQVSIERPRFSPRGQLPYQRPGFNMPGQARLPSPMNQEPMLPPGREVSQGSKFGSYGKLPDRGLSSSNLPSNTGQGRRFDFGDQIPNQAAKGLPDAQNNRGPTKSSFEQGSTHVQTSDLFSQKNDVLGEGKTSMQSEQVFGRRVSRFDQATQKIDGFAPRFEQLPSKFDQPPPRFVQPPPRFDQSPARFNQPPSKFDQPPSKFEQLRPKFDQPRPRFDQPRSRFDQPTPRFDQPPPKFDQPPPGFDQPPPGFDQPPRFDQPPPRFDQTLPRTGQSANGTTRPRFGMPNSSNRGPPPLMGKFPNNRFNSPQADQKFELNRGERLNVEELHQRSSSGRYSEGGAQGQQEDVRYPISFTEPPASKGQVSLLWQKINDFERSKNYKQTNPEESQHISGQRRDPASDKFSDSNYLNDLGTHTQQKFVPPSERNLNFQGPQTFTLREQESNFKPGGSALYSEQKHFSPSEQRPHFSGPHDQSDRFGNPPLQNSQQSQRYSTDSFSQQDSLYKPVATPTSSFQSSPFRGVQTSPVRAFSPSSFKETNFGVGSQPPNPQNPLPLQTYQQQSNMGSQSGLTGANQPPTNFQLDVKLNQQVPQTSNMLQQITYGAIRGPPPTANFAMQNSPNLCPPQYGNLSSQYATNKPNGFPQSSTTGVSQADAKFGGIQQQNSQSLAPYNNASSIQNFGQVQDMVPPPYAGAQPAGPPQYGERPPPPQSVTPKPLMQNSWSPYSSPMQSSQYKSPRPSTPQNGPPPSFQFNVPPPTFQKNVPPPTSQYNGAQPPYNNNAPQPAMPYNGMPPNHQSSNVQPLPNIGNQFHMHHAQQNISAQQTQQYSDVKQMPSVGGQFQVQTPQQISTMQQGPNAGTQLRMQIPPQNSNLQQGPHAGAQLRMYTPQQNSSMQQGPNGAAQLHMQPPQQNRIMQQQGPYTGVPHRMQTPQNSSQSSHQYTPSQPLTQFSNTQTPAPNTQLPQNTGTQSQLPPSSTMQPPSLISEGQTPRNSGIQPVAQPYASQPPLQNSSVQSIPQNSFPPGSQYYMQSPQQNTAVQGNTALGNQPSQYMMAPPQQYNWMQPQPQFTSMQMPPQYSTGLYGIEPQTVSPPAPPIQSPASTTTSTGASHQTTTTAVTTTTTSALSSEVMAQATAAAQQYIQYYQQWYSSTMGNVPGFDLAGTMAQVSTYAHQYYQQYYSQSSNAGALPPPELNAQNTASTTPSSQLNKQTTSAKKSDEPVTGPYFPIAPNQHGVQSSYQQVYGQAPFSQTATTTMTTTTGKPQMSGQSTTTSVIPTVAKKPMTYNLQQQQLLGKRQAPTVSSVQAKQPRY